MRILAFLLLSLGLWAQDRPFTFGVTAGLPITNGSNYSRNDESRRYTFGILGEYRFTDHISVQVNPLYKRTGNGIFFSSLFATVPGAEILQYSRRERFHHLEIPFLGKYYFGAPSSTWRPFLGAGFSLNTAWRQVNAHQVQRDATTGVLTPSSIQVNNRTRFDTGAVTAAGIDFRVPRVHIAPEFRYTFNGSNDANKVRNQVDFLVSFRF